METVTKEAMTDYKIDTHDNLKASSNSLKEKTEQQNVSKATRVLNMTRIVNMTRKETATEHLKAS